MRNGILIFFLCFLLGDCSAVFDPESGVQTERVAIGSTSLNLEMRKRHAHLFLAEYNFTAALVAGSTELDSVEMTGDTGGLSRIDILALNQRMIAIRDHTRRECLSLATQRFERCPSETTGRPLGYFDFDSERRWKFFLAAD